MEALLINKELKKDMKKFVFSIAIIAIVAVATISAPSASARAGVLLGNSSIIKPTSSWQVYNIQGNVLTVHESVEDSLICFPIGS